MTTTINASTSTGLVSTADTSGIIKVQSNGVTTNAIAWCNFNGTTATIRSAYNVSSITGNSAGDYTLNFTNALTDANYSIVATGSENRIAINNTSRTNTTSAANVLTRTILDVTADSSIVTTAIFGN